MPRTKLGQGFRNYESNQQPKTKTGTKTGRETQTKVDLMADFEPSDRKDLTYLGKKQRAEERLEHLEKKLNEINAQLKADGVRVSIRKGSQNSLVLRATLPLKPEDAAKGGMPTKRYDLSLGIPFNKEGLNEAKTKAYELSRLMTTKTFTWSDDWLGSKSLAKKAQAEQPKTFGEAIEEFKVKYFHTRKRNRQSETSCKTHLRYIAQKISCDSLFTSKTITEAIHATEAGSNARYMIVNALSVLCNTLGFDYDFKGLTNGYEPKEKTLPSDNEVLDFYNVFVPSKLRPEYQWEAWRWLYGILATYGLRIHEVWAIDLEKFLDPSNIENIITLDESKTEGLKTGEREVFPYHPECVKLFNVKDVKIPELIGDIGVKTSRVCRRFKDSKIPFTPHTLRHAYAVRGYRLGIPVKEMADSMGHDLTTHTQTYQKYMTLDDRKEIVKKALARGKAEREHKSEVEVLREQLKSKDEIIKAQQERIAQLETELLLMKEIGRM